ncbi:MAG: DAK2 domain-containing protein [Candidatus Izemoplasmatales bacterium]|nr:DAK2 domain-containing protein [Candidatus Izemoplasmatales bacterium]
MPNEYLDGALFHSAIKETLRKLTLKRKSLNQINVFPVPDGDTGNNLLATIESAYHKVSNQSESQLGEAAKAAYLGAREGSTGNSGAIFTQFLKGFATVFSGKDKAGAIELANAVREGTRNAYQAIRDPREGTILTVARKAFEAVETIARDNTLASTLLIMYLEARKALANTVRVLPVLKEKKVIDAGGWGLLIFFSALLDVMGVPSGVPEYNFQTKTTFYESRHSFAFTNPYDMEFVLPAFSDMERQIARRIEMDGTELIIQPNDTDCHVHIHTDNPHRVVEKIMALAPIQEIVLRDMYSQSVDHAARDDGGPNYRTVVIGKHPGFLAMAIMTGAEMALNEQAVSKLARLLDKEDPTDVLMISSVEATDHPVSGSLVRVKDDVKLLASLVTVFSTERPSEEVILLASEYPRMAIIDRFDPVQKDHPSDQSVTQRITDAIKELKPVTGEVLTLFFGSLKDKSQLERVVVSLREEYPDLSDIDLRFGSQPEALILEVE